MKIIEWIAIYEDGNSVGTMSPVYAMEEWLELMRSKHNEK